MKDPKKNIRGEPEGVKPFGTNLPFNIRSTKYICPSCSKSYIQLDGDKAPDKCKCGTPLTKL